jgi:hypothetical protein
MPSCSNASSSSLVANPKVFDTAMGRSRVVFDSHGGVSTVMHCPSLQLQGAVPFCPAIAGGSSGAYQTTPHSAAARIVHGQSRAAEREWYLEHLFVSPILRRVMRPCGDWSDCYSVTTTIVPDNRTYRVLFWQYSANLVYRSGTSYVALSNKICLR